MEKITLSRTQLYELVWTQTTPTLAKEYGITDHSLRMICKTNNIPRLLGKAKAWQTHQKSSITSQFRWK